MNSDDLNRLKPSVLWRESDDAIMVEHGRRSFEMRGSQVSSVVSRLLPMLDGSRSVEEVRTNLPDPIKSLFDRLINELRSRSMLTSGGPVLQVSSGIPEEIIRLMQDRCEDWPAAVQAWSSREITIVAPAELAKDIDRHCKAMSVKSTRIATPDLEELSGDLSLVIWVARDADSALKAGQIKPNGLGVGGVIRGPLAAIVSSDKDPFRSLLALFEKIPVVQEDLSDVILSGFCALVAHEALELHLRAFQGSDQEFDQRDELRLFRRDGSVRQLHLDTALLSNGPFDIDRAAIADSSEVDPQTAPLFDRDTNLLSWADDDEGSVPYPLFHRSVALSSFAAVEGSERIVTEWGLTPEEADGRAIRAALLGIANMESPQAEFPDCSPIFAGTDEAEVLGMAAAARAAEQHKLWDDTNRVKVELEPACEAELSTMLRLARLFDNGDMPQLFVASDPEKTAFVATASLVGMTASQLATSRDRALYEAIGAVLSALQRGTTIPSPKPDGVAASHGAPSFVPCKALDFAKYGFAVGRVRYA